MINVHAERHTNKKTEVIIMTMETMKKKIAQTLEDMIWKHHFRAQYEERAGWLPQVERGCDSYIQIVIREEPEYDSNEQACIYRIKAYAAVCQMNHNSDTLELHRAAEEIERGATLVDAINAIGLAYTAIFKPQINGTILENDGKALPQLLGSILKPGTFRHAGSFVFNAETKDGRQVIITTEPADPEDDEHKQIRIIDLAII